MSSLVLQTFGSEKEYRRAILTVLSYYAYKQNFAAETKTLLFTDNPTYFEAYVKGLPVEYVSLTPEKIKAMRGAINFLHRMKIAVIEEAFRISKGNLLYADSDTFFTADPSPLLNQLTPATSFMHLREYTFESMRQFALPAGETFHAFLKLIESKSFHLSDGSEITISPQEASWNAGVMLFHPSHARFIPDVYALTDQFYPPTRNHASEQYAFSILLQRHTNLRACDSVIYHYWYRIKKQIVDLFLKEKINASWAQLPLGDKLAQVRQWIDHLPAYFDRHLLTLQDNAIQAFNENKFAEGYQNTFKALIKAPFEPDFLKNVLYHTKRRLLNKLG